MDNPNFYSTSNYRLACALIANGYELEGVHLSTYFAKKQYVFISSDELYQTVHEIEEGKDKISALSLYLANDFLTKQIGRELYRKEIEEQLLLKEKNDV